MIYAVKKDDHGNPLYNQVDLTVLLNVIKNKLGEYKDYAIKNDKSDIGLGELAGKIIDVCYNVTAESFNKTFEHGTPNIQFEIDEKNFIL